MCVDYAVVSMLDISLALQVARKIAARNHALICRTLQLLSGVLSLSLNVVYKLNKISMYCLLALTASVLLKK